MIFLGGCIETPAGTNAAVHFYAATANMVSASEIYGSPFYVDYIVEEPFQLEGDSFTVPDAPGLGVTVDEARLAEYRINF